MFSSASRKAGEAVGTPWHGAAGSSHDLHTKQLTLPSVAATLDVAWQEKGLRVEFLCATWQFLCVLPFFSPQSLSRNVSLATGCSGGGYPGGRAGE